MAKRKRKKSFGKLIMIAMILICLEIVVYAEIAMIYLADLSSLYALIGIVASLAVAIWAYCEKSSKENTAGGIVYDAAMRAMAAVAPEETEDPDDNTNNEED